MKTYHLFLAFLLLISTSFISCNNDTLNENVSQQDEPTFTISKCENPDAIEQVFTSHASQTRSLGNEVTLDEYDFTQPMEADFINREEILYLIPSKQRENELLAGISIDTEIVYLLKLSKISNNVYALYNEANEPICDVQYDITKQTIIIINNYGNDAIVTPTTRGRWYSFACNVAIGTAATAAAGLAAPTMGASLGMVVCTALVQMLIC